VFLLPFAIALSLLYYYYSERQADKPPPELRPHINAARRQLFYRFKQSSHRPGKPPFYP